jgi:site-specific DNA recombinase
MNVGYLRTSTTLQSNRLKTDEDTIKKYCELYDIQLDHLYTDFGVSGGTFDRDQFNEMMNQVRQGNVKTIIITELSRWGRSLYEMIGSVQILKKYNTNLVIIKEGIDLTTSSGKMFMNLLGVMSEYERDLVSERVKNVLNNKKENNKPYCRNVYGFDRVDDQLVPNQVEQRMIKKILMLRHKKGYSYGEIVKYLSRNNYKSKSNSEITRNSVVGIIKNLDKNHDFSSIN